MGSGGVDQTRRPRLPGPERGLEKPSRSSAWECPRSPTQYAHQAPNGWMRIETPITEVARRRPTEEKGALVVGIPGVSRLLWKLGQLFDTWFTRWENDWNTTFSPESFSFDSLGVKQGRLLHSAKLYPKNVGCHFWNYFSDWNKLSKFYFYSILITIRMHFSHSCAANKWK